MIMKTISHRTLALAPLLALLHCGSSASGSTPSQGNAPRGSLGDDAGASNAVDAGDPTADGQAGPVQPAPSSGGDTADAGCKAGASDPPDDMGADTNCDGADGVAGKDVYLDPVNGQDTNDGTPKTPLHSLAAALTMATGRGGNVLVAAGSLPDATLSVPGAWAVYGGYGPGFIGPPTRSLTTFAPPSTGLLIEQASSVHLAHMTVKSQTPQAGAAPTGGGDAGTPWSLSAHALRSSVAKLELDDMVLIAPQGADGSAGVGGTAGLDGNGTNRCSLPTWSFGATTGLSSDGVTPPGNVANKSAAPPATNGYDGTDGTDAAGTLSLALGVVSGAAPGNGRSDGTPGYGGASGGSGTWQSISFSGGVGGSGGCPGSGGTGGTSAGSSIALVVLFGSASVTRSTLQAGLGGQGGDGGAAGPGGAGQPGGTPLASWHTMFANAPPPTCDPNHAANDPMGFGCAAYGGPGGAGGAGGHGGGGAGGWSIGTLTASAASVSLDSATTVTTAKAGLGGLGSQGSRAPAGQVHQQYAMP